ncbi:hypothetical protein G5C60_35850 [Streptomyces sp. HC44]|uniref:Uncharacterized protein n=1 Tax=Streptomyces scabichelini TaxID=2711217 RepID=A0A6G4VGC5_9ACTN|nr:hypothetical protein [Streptomyces scabichelini]NGO12837.1 hypothetical protein [Streptomyces scabichelini]
MPGTVLLLAASPVGKGCLVDATSVLPVLAAVAPAVLSGTDTANVVELADPLEPQAVLTRLRAAATAVGPLTVFVTGQLQLDRRQRLPHLALARTTPSTVRYTGFPWHWVREELRLRAPGSTTVFVDLHADAETWQHLVSRPLDVGPGVRLYGRVAPPPPRRTLAVPTYMKSLATILRSGHRPLPAQLHQQALTRASGEELEGARRAQRAQRDIVLAVDSTPAPFVPAPFTPAASPPVMPASGDPHAEIASAVEAGRHGEAAELAARWEQDALRTYGPGSDEVVHWMEVRADLAMFAGDAALSCRTWLAVAGVRLGAGQSAEDSAVEAAVDRAHHQWGRIADAGPARELGAALVELRRRVPGRREGALQHVQQRLEWLRGAQRVG